MTWKQCVGKTELRHPLAIDLTASRIAQEGKLLAYRAKNSSPISLKKNTVHTKYDALLLDRGLDWLIL